MTAKNIEAYNLALEASKIDFSAALQGLMAGHGVTLNRMREELAQSDMAFLMALALTEKGKRLDKEGLMASKITERLSGMSLCEAERRFIQANLPQQRAECAEGET